MITITAKEAHERFGEVMDKARSEPVTITKHGHPTVVLVSYQRYLELEALEDKVWIAKAEEAEKGGLLGVEESEAFIQGILNAEA